jgi:hypothetical protein
MDTGVLGMRQSSRTQFCMIVLISGSLFRIHPHYIPEVHCSCKPLYSHKPHVVRELIAVKVLHTSLLNITVVTFKVLPLRSYALMPAPSPSLKQYWNWVCGIASRAAVVLFLMSSVSSKCLPFNISFIFWNRKKSLGARN